MVSGITIKNHGDTTMACDVESALEDQFWDWFSDLDADVLINALEDRGFTVIPLKR